MKAPRLLAVATVAACLGLAAPAPADVIVLNNGQTLRGIIDATTRDESTVKIETAIGKLTVMRSRIKSIEQESPAQGYIHIGNDHRAKDQLSDALRAYQRAQQLEPANPQVQTLMDEVQREVTAREQLNRQGALQQIDELTRQARELIERQQFDEAEARLKDADRLVPNDQQRATLQALVGEFYLAWARERLDKLDKAGAEEKLKLALGAQPDNQEIVDELLALWENDPQKREQAAAVYETILQRREDDANLRKKLADLYYELNQPADAVAHYLKLYRDNPDYQGTDLEQRLVEMLDKLHKEQARQRNYAEAIRTFNVLAQLDPTADPTSVVFYEYMRQAQELGDNDPARLLQLAQFAEQNGLDEEAMKHYNRLVTVDSTRAQAQAGIDRYASRALQQAQFYFNQGQWPLALTLAEQIIRDYPNSKAVVEEAVRLSGRAREEAARDLRQREVFAEAYVERGDEYFQQAQIHYNNIFSTERRDIPRLSSDKAEAKRYYQYAIDSYEEAIRRNPNLQSDPRSLVMVRLRESREKIRRLSQPPTAGVRSFNRTIN
ncbi:MAG TPA: tetratricopeptide repeat protein [Candidatus Sumerlaeota bacterium]|nr:MAG: Tetratricopeptide repeat protein [candidate division BRC1 bacterium ADurb.BinA292]HOE97548.1 tetratricopeptide repeat protein [Candidatus Sumerlaeota bacterium]HOR28215.1 tetratricopeptide repeat protein [Candidatus Sumerlaeota bacterium]HPK02214.1 tetratricopeptide repeat protein [Candidatus Sumerlaeota bacterium]